MLNGTIVSPGKQASFRAAPLAIWKTITLGAHKDAKALRAALNSAECITTHDADDDGDTLGNPGFTLATRPTKVDLVIRSVQEMGFGSTTSYPKICARAEELGLGLCPAEVGSALRLAYTDQPVNEWLHIAMKPILGSSGEKWIFEVIHDGPDGLWLDTGGDAPNLAYRCDDLFVFVLPRT